MKAVSKSKCNYNQNMSIEMQCYIFGREYFGPFLYGFTKWLNEEIQKSDIERIYFFARDGYMMEKAYGLLYKDKSTKYVYFSRKSIRQALLYKSKSYADSLSYVTEERYMSFGKLLRYYGFDKEEAKTIAEERKISLAAEYRKDELQDVEELIEFYNEYRDQIHKKSEQQARLLRQYLEENEFKGKCAIVDIGWHGSMQYYLEKFVRSEAINVQFFGFYVGINPSYDIMGNVKGYLYSSNNKIRKKVLCFLGGYEKLFQSLEGSTKGYVLKQGHIYPDLDSYEYQNEKNLISRIEMWQTGAADYICKVTGDIKLTDRQLAASILKFGMNPPNWGLKLFQGFFIDDGGKQFFLPDRKLTKYTVNELKHSLSNSVWKTGFMKSLLRLPFPYYAIYCLMRK